MCNPAAFMIGMSIAAMGSQYMQQQQMMDQAKEQEKMATQAALAQQALEEEQLQQTLEEARAQGETDKFAVAREAAKNRGQIMASASEAGAFGNVMLRELAENMMQEGYDTSLIDYNYRNTVKNAELRRKGSAMNAMNTINANKAPKVNGLLSGLQIGMAGAQGAMSGYGMGKSMDGLFTTTSSPTGPVHVGAGGTTAYQM